MEWENVVREKLADTAWQNELNPVEAELKIWVTDATYLEKDYDELVEGFCEEDMQDEFPFAYGFELDGQKLIVDTYGDDLSDTIIQRGIETLSEVFSDIELQSLEGDNLGRDEYLEVFSDEQGY